MHIEFLVEEPSMEIALKILVPKIVGSQHTFCIPETLDKLLKDHGYQGLFKTQFAQQVAPHVDIDNNRSTSFQHFRDGLRMLINHNQKFKS
jgi:hypothetical protein